MNPHNPRISSFLFQCCVDRRPPASVMLFNRVPSPKEGRPRMARLPSPSFGRIRSRQRNLLVLLLLGICTCVYLISSPAAEKTHLTRNQKYDQHVIPSSQAHDQGVWTERANIDESIRGLIANIPGEILSRDLLKPVEGTGRSKLREIGLRVRAFKTIFEAWEKVHMAHDPDGNAFVRDDIVQYLRGTSNFDDTTGDDPVGSTLASTTRSYAHSRNFLAQFTELLFPWFHPYYSDLLTLKASFFKGGRGIVLTAGEDQAPWLLTTIPSLRRLGCTLPIEIMYLGESDLSDDFRVDFEAMPGVITRDIVPMVSDKGWKLAGWAAKPFAILLSSFREVIFIDADSAFFEDPETLFEDPTYRKTGALFFLDRHMMPENKRKWLQEILPQPISRSVRNSRMWTGASAHQQESGVVVVDKWKHFVAMLLVTRMNGPDRDGDKSKELVGVYDMMYGDKETFWLGWELAGDLAYSFHQGGTGTMGEVEEPDQVITEHIEVRREENQQESLEESIEEEKYEESPVQELQSSRKNYTICAPQILHLGMNGKPLWFNGWLLENKFGDKKKPKYKEFREYLIEPGNENPHAYQSGSSNIACLTSGPHLRHQFEPQALRTIDWLVEKAKEVHKERVR